MITCNNITLKMIFCLILIPIVSIAQPHISGYVSGTLGPGDYIVDGNISVRSTDTLIIEPGTSFLHSGQFGWQIDGALQANGTESDSIRFTRLGPNPAYIWSGVAFQPVGLISCTLNYCIIEDVYSNLSGGGIYISGNRLTVSNSRISRCETYGDGGGIYANNASMLLIENCQIDSCIANKGGGIALTNSSGARIVDNKIIYNSTNGT